ncbi:MAG: rod shape-determining protein MreD [Planctomycetes bacterium]|nr:rod shape-determining protein MreD [Planctomycetota bacterium]
MRWVRFLILVLVVCMIDTTLMPRISLAGMRPDIALIFVMFISLNTTPVNAVPAGWLMGLATDVYSVGPTGLNALILSLCAGFISGAKDLVYKENPFVQLLLAVIVAIFSNGVYLTSIVLSPDTSVGSPGGVAFRMLCAVVYTSLPAPFLLLVLRLLKRWLGIGDKITLEPREER